LTPTTAKTTGAMRTRSYSRLGKALLNPVPKKTRTWSMGLLGDLLKSCRLASKRGIEA